MAQFSIPQDLLPDDPYSRHSALRDYFCDKDAVAILRERHWEVDLHWPGGLDRHVDPCLGEGLLWWGGGVTPEAMRLSRRREGRIVRTLFDSWTLHTWSEWAARDRPGVAPVILHVDDHRDTMSPRVFIGPEGWLDPLAGRCLAFDDPASVAAAIESGAVGMGSFMTLMLHRFPDAEVRHLCQAPKVTATRDLAFRPSTERDTLLSPGAERPALDLMAGAGGTGPGRFRQTADLDDWLERLPDAPVLLHVDLDYFNNRYDGDGDWAERVERLDPPLDVVLARVDALADALTRAQVGPRIEDVTIAFSPGFFPAELWAPVSGHLVRRIEGL